MISKKKYQRLPLSTLLIYALYQTIFPFFIIYGLLIALKRSLKEPSHLKRLSDRFGLGPIGEKGAIWIYAASLGEMNAARPLVQVFLDNGHYILLTHLSPAGLQAGQKFFGDNPKVTHRYMPLDFFLLVRLFLLRARPSCGIVLEIETWPAMLVEADKLKLPMYLANGNLVALALKRLESWKRHSLYMYRLFNHIFTRSEEYVDRYRGTGVQLQDLTVIGDLKLENPRNPELIAKGQAWRKAWIDESFTLLIASSVQAEEEILIQSCIELFKKVPNMRVIWVPRSPQRFEALSKKIKNAGIVSTNRSKVFNDISPINRLLVGDSIGEMDLYLGMADIVFVGASFNNGGGHNIVEALSAGCPVVMGPSTHGIDEVAKDAASAGVFYSFAKPEEMTSFIIGISKSSQKLDQMRTASSTFCKMNVGASQLCYKVIKSLN
jgi:3-deoxy-D-manno-octulosonic-acid transferase